jgi:hypothetical protein
VGLLFATAAELNAALGISFANNRPGCSSQRVCVLHCFIGFEGVFAVVVVMSFSADLAGVDGEVRAGRIEDIDSIEVGVVCDGNIEDIGFGDDIATSVADGEAAGRIGGGIPGGRFFIGDIAALF